MQYFFYGGQNRYDRCTPAGALVCLEASVVATISLSFDCFSKLVRFSKIRFSIFSFFFFVYLELECGSDYLA